VRTTDQLSARSKSREPTSAANSDDAEIPERVGIQMQDARGAQKERESQQQAKRRHDAIGRNDNSTDVEEYGIHLREG
jgi:hypothetical protein